MVVVVEDADDQAPGSLPNSADVTSLRDEQTAPQSSHLIIRAGFLPACLEKGREGLRKLARNQMENCA